MYLRTSKVFTSHVIRFLIFVSLMVVALPACGNSTRYQDHATGTETHIVTNFRYDVLNGSDVVISWESPKTTLNKIKGFIIFIAMLRGDKKLKSECEFEPIAYVSSERFMVEGDNLKYRYIHEKALWDKDARYLYKIVVMNKDNRITDYSDLLMIGH